MLSPASETGLLSNTNYREVAVGTLFFLNKDEFICAIITGFLMICLTKTDNLTSSKWNKLQIFDCINIYTAHATKFVQLHQRLQKNQ